MAQVSYYERSDGLTAKPSVIDEVIQRMIDYSQ